MGQRKRLRDDVVDSNRCNKNDLTGDLSCKLPAMDELTDQELLSRYTLQKNEEAFSQLVRRHLPVVFHTAHRQLGDHHLSEETAQTVFAILARKAGRLRTHPCLVAWLHRTAYFIARRTVRKEHRREARMKSYQAQQTIACGPAEAKWDSEHRHFLDRALQRLETLPPSPLRDAGFESHEQTLRALAVRAGL